MLQRLSDLFRSFAKDFQSRRLVLSRVLAKLGPRDVSPLHGRLDSDGKE